MRHSITLLFLIFTFSSSAQVWIDQNANWHYEFWNLGTAGYYDLQYTQDETIGGKICQKIEETVHTFYPFGTPLSTVSGPTQYTYVSSDTVFYWNDGQFFTLFDFGASVGDQWLIGISDPMSGDYMCHDSSYVEVTDTGSVVINSVNYRTITLATVENSSIGLVGIFVERFGFIDVSTTYHLFPRYMNCSNAALEWNVLSFSCFEDDSFSLYNPSGESCELFSGLSENQILPEIQLFPNPTKDLVNLIPSESGTLQIIDCSGKIVQVATISGSELIDLSGLENGIYIFTFRSTSGSMVRERVLKID